MKELIEKLRDGCATDRKMALDELATNELLNQAADAIARLENEALAATIRIDNDALTISELTKEKDTCDSGAGCLHKDAVIESLKLDATRYQAIKPMSRAISLNIDGLHYWHIQLRGNVRGPTLDAAIDASMKGGVE